MVDTGMSSAEWATKYHHDARKGDCLNSPDAIRKLGFDPEEVDLCFTDNSYCGVCRTSGADKLWWMLLNPHMIDPWKFQRLDAVCVTHQHQDHMDFYTISAALQTTHCKFIAPPEASRRMKKNMGVPEDRLIVAEVGKNVQIADMKIDIAPNFDVIATKTGFETPQPFEEVAASFIFNTEGGNIAFLGDTLYHNGYRMVGQSYKIDVVCMDMGNNARGIQTRCLPGTSGVWPRLSTLRRSFRITMTTMGTVMKTLLIWILL